MSEPSKRRRKLHRLIPAAVGMLGVVVSTLVACSNTTEPDASRIVYGPAQSLGQGTARVYVALNGAGKPTSLGIALTEGSMNALPQTPLPGGGMSAVNLILALPAEAKATGFDHAMLDWNPMGHEPDMVYTLPHFDFHFYNSERSGADGDCTERSGVRCEARQDARRAVSARGEHQAAGRRADDGSALGGSDVSRAPAAAEQ